MVSLAVLLQNERPGGPHQRQDGRRESVQLEEVLVSNGSRQILQICGAEVRTSKTFPNSSNFQNSGKTT